MSKHNCVIVFAVLVEIPIICVRGQEGIFQRLAPPYILVSVELNRSPSHLVQVIQ